VAGEVLYLDASALVKLVNVESESIALASMVAEWSAHATSVLGAVEVRLAVRRSGGDMERAEAVLDSVSLVELDVGVRELAAMLEPVELRTLDALHVASAISLEDDLGALACYDARLAEAARREGVRVLSPA
jgi:hypothetical protein